MSSEKKARPARSLALCAEMARRWDECKNKAERQDLSKELDMPLAKIWNLRGWWLAATPEQRASIQIPGSDSEPSKAQQD